MINGEDFDEIRGAGFPYFIKSTELKTDLPPEIVDLKKSFYDETWAELGSG